METKAEKMETVQTQIQLDVQTVKTEQPEQNRRIESIENQLLIHRAEDAGQFMKIPKK